MYFYIKVVKSFFNVPREKLSPRLLAAESDNLEDVKGFRGQAVHNFFVLFVIIIKRTSKIYFTVNEYVKSNDREIGFRGLF
jgi:hypothetical protein